MYYRLESPPYSSLRCSPSICNEHGEVVLCKKNNHGILKRAEKLLLILRSEKSLLRERISISSRAFPEFTESSPERAKTSG